MLNFLLINNKKIITCRQASVMMTTNICVNYVIFNIPNQIIYQYLFKDNPCEVIFNSAVVFVLIQTTFHSCYELKNSKINEIFKHIYKSNANI